MKANTSNRFSDAVASIFGFTASFLTHTTFPVSDSFTVTAHTGCLGTNANSLEAIEKGIAAGAQIVEFDLSFDGSGTPVLSHDAPKGKCVPLEDAFALLGRHSGIKANVDVKDTSGLEQVPILAERYGVLARIFFTGVGEKDVPIVREKCPGIPYYLNTTIFPHTDLYALAEKVKVLGALGVNINKGCLSPRLTRIMHAQGLLVSVWTIDRRPEARYVLATQPDNVTSRCPDMICGMLR